MENWKDIPEWENYYEISDLGRVRSKVRIGYTFLGRREYGGKVLKPIIASNKYHVVNLTKRDPVYIRKQYSIHNLVLMAFIGNRPKGWHGCHNNGDKSDNRLINLRWATALSNAEDKKKHGTIPRGEAHQNSRYTEAQAREVYRLFSEENMKIIRISEKLGLNYRFVKRICNKEVWRFIHEKTGN